MTGIPGYKMAVNEFVTQAQSWLTQATKAAQASAAKIEAGTYGAADASADMVQGTTLIVSGWMGWFAACLDAATEVSTPPSTTSKPSVTVTVLAATFDRDLAVPAQLVSVKGDTIPASKATLTPKTLPAGATSFQLDVDSAGANLGIYYAHVTLTPTTGGAADTVTATVLVT